VGGQLDELDDNNHHDHLDEQQHQLPVGLLSVRAVLWGKAPPFLVERSRLAWPGCELSCDAPAGLSDDSWLLWPGAVPLAPGEIAPLRPSQAGRPLLAVGAAWSTPAALEGGWSRLLWKTGGDLDAGDLASVPLPSLMVDASLARAWATAHDPTAKPIDTLIAVAKRCRARVVRHASLDVFFDERPRVLQVVTSLQQGGAERLVVELAQAFARLRVAVELVTVGVPLRSELPRPTHVHDLSAKRRDPVELATAIGALADRCGADLVHAHLLSGPELHALGQLSRPVVATIHNARPGWPAGLDGLSASDVDLLCACSLSVEDDLREACVLPVVRTIWNGIEPERVMAGPDARVAERARLGLGDETVLLAVANPRPQKRLERLPPLVARLDNAVLLVAGDIDGPSPAARKSEADWATAVEAAGPRVAARIRRLGSVREMAPLYAAADVLVSTSAYEGLSLAQLEARAAGLPVVATRVGGAEEIAAGDAGMTLVDAEAGAAELATAVGTALASAPFLAPSSEGEGREDSRAHRLAPRFSVAAAARRHLDVYHAVLQRRAGRRRGGLILVANNFSIGGAQSSGRRLLVEMRARGVPVSAVVLEEDPGNPTPGRRALEAAGIEVQALPPPPGCPPAEATSLLRERLLAERPDGLIFWNAITEHKVRLADALLDAIPIVDVSPGEMYFSSLETFVTRFAGRPDAPLRDARDYARRLRALVVKYSGEREQAAQLGAKVVVIGNGVPLPERAARGSGGGRLVIGTAARLAPHKRLDLLLEAFAHARPRLPPSLLRIAGGAERTHPEHAAELCALTARLGLEDCVEWLGPLTDIGPFLDGLDLFAMVSEPAGCPNASLEAMAAGLAVVATDHGGAREQIPPSAGIIVPRHDVEAFADALVALASDGEHRRALAAGAREHVRTHHSMAAMTDAYLALF
jgi:glycosyltransferase involved in cell wall biosynthesis